MTFYRHDYASLAVLSLAYVVAVMRYQTTPRYVILATLIYGLSYLIWGIIHHLCQHNFHARIVLEYLLVAILAMAIVSTLLL